MQFAAPLALLFSLLAIPIVIFYILKIRLRRIPVSTVMFWNQIYDERKPRSIWQRFRHVLSLLLQLIFLILLMLAIADPFFLWRKEHARRIVLVIDNSASMRATDLTPNRLSVAREEGHLWIRGLRLQDEMAIVSAGSTPRVEVGLTSHQRTLHDTLDAVPLTDGPTNVAAAVRLARSLLAPEHKNGQAILLTDGCFTEAETLAKADDVGLIACGKRTSNVGITQFQVRRSLLDVIGYQILIEISNASEDPVECRLEVNLNEELVDVVPLKLAAEERVTRVLDHTAAAGGELVATLDVQDALLADNRAVALLPRRQRQPVILVSKGSHFLQSAFEALPLVDLMVTSEPPANPSSAIVVYDNVNSTTVPPGNTFFVQPNQSTDLWNLGETVDEPIVTKQDLESSLMTHVRLENVLMPSARKIQFAEHHQVLAQSLDNQPLYVAVEHAHGKTLVLTVDLEKADLPLRTAFPIMIANAMTWFQGNQGELREAVSTGSVANYQLPETNADSPSTNSSDVANTAPGDEIVLQAPNGSERPLPSGVKTLTVGSLDQCGVWKIGRRGTSTGSKSVDESRDSLDPIAEIACNMSNRTESDIRALNQNDQPARAHVFGGRPLWFYLVVLGFMLSTMEWFLYQRRWIS